MTALYLFATACYCHPSFVAAFSSDSSQMRCDGMVIRCSPVLHLGFLLISFLFGPIIHPTCADPAATEAAVPPIPVEIRGTLQLTSYCQPWLSLSSEDRQFARDHIQVRIVE